MNNQAYDDTATRNPSGRAEVFLAQPAFCMVSSAHALLAVSATLM